MSAARRTGRPTLPPSGCYVLAMVKRTHLPLADLWDDHAPGTLTWLQAWYAMQTDGDWEQACGVSISTLDNPGWSVSIELDGTPLGGRTFPKQEVHRSEHDWYVARVERNVFEAACGPLNLGEVLHLFRLWVDGEPRMAD